jgi:carboxypeptidase T
MSSQRSRRSRRPFLAAVAAGAIALAVAYVPTAQAVHPTATIQNHTMYDISVRALDGDGQRLGLRLMAQGFDVLEKREGAIVHVLGNQATARTLAGIAGAAVVGKIPAAPQGAIPKAPKNQDDILPKRLKGNHYQTFYGGYRTVEGYDKFETDLEKAYPELVQKVTFGKSFTGKYGLNAVCITANADKGCQLKPNVDKARFLLETRIHAREVATSEMSWRWMTMLVDGYGKDAQVTSLLDGTEIWLVPEVNPDGAHVSEVGTKGGFGDDSPAWQRKNWDRKQTPPGGCPPPWAGSQPGVDLNRNWAFGWGGASTSKDPCSEVFLGKKKMSETETQQLAQLTKDLFRDQKGNGQNDPAPKDTTGEMMTFHTNAGVNIIPWDYTPAEQTPNDEGIRTFAFRQSYYTGLETGQAGQVLYSVGGGTDDWAYAELGIMSSTWELRRLLPGVPVYGRLREGLPARAGVLG